MPKRVAALSYRTRKVHADEYRFAKCGEYPNHGIHSSVPAGARIVGVANDHMTADFPREVRPRREKVGLGCNERKHAHGGGWNEQCQPKTAKRRSRRHLERRVRMSLSVVNSLTAIRAERPIRAQSSSDSGH